MDKKSIPLELQIANRKAHLHYAIVPGSSLQDSIAALSFANNLQLRSTTNIRLFSTFGVHPYNAALPGRREEFTQQLKLAFSHPDSMQRPVAIGECGLDTSAGFPAMDKQLEWFQHQLDLACELQDCPLFLHERGAHDLFMCELVKRRDQLHGNNKLLVHCFTGTEQELQTYLDFGCYVSISGIVCRADKEGKRIRQVLQRVNPPANRLLLETDAPYMQFPQCRKLCEDNPQAKSPNVPSAIIQVAEAVSVCLNRPLNEVCRDSFQATCEFFNV